MLLLTAARRALAIAVLGLVPAVPAQAATDTWTGLTFTTTSMELGSSLKATAAVGSSAGVPSGDVRFISCGPFSVDFNCRDGIRWPLGPGTVPLDAAGRATSVDYQPGQVGWSCIRALYLGNAQFNGSTADECVKVHAATSMTATLSAPSISFGASIAETVRVTSAGGTPTGQVRFSASDGTDLGSRALSEGAVVSPSFTPSRPGRFCLTAEYAGTEFLTASTRETCFDVTGAATSASVTPSATSIEFGASVGAQAQVSSAVPGLTGTVSFAVCGPLASATGCAAGGAAAGSATLTSGAAAAPSFKPGSAGTYCFRADYGGTAVFAPATSVGLACFTVRAAATTTSTTPSRASIARGESVTASSTVGSAAGAPTGTVGFWVCGPLAARTGCANGGTALGSQSLADGSARSAGFTPDATGFYCVRSAYGGATSFLASGDATDAGCFSVGGAPSAVRLAAQDAVITYGQATRPIATVTSNAGTPTGTVTFAVCGPLAAADGCSAGGVTLSSAVVTDGVATGPELTPRAAGVYCYRAGYVAADAGFVDSGADGGCFEVRKATLRVDAAPSSKTQGEADPEPGWTLATDDFVLGDTAGGSAISGAPRCQIASHPEGPGTYERAIACEPGSLASSNYAFTAGRPAALTITPRTDPPGGGDTGGGGGGGTTTPIPSTPPPGAGAEPPSTPGAANAPDNRAVITGLRAKKDGTLTLTVRVPGAGRVEVTPSAGKRASTRKRTTAPRAGVVTVKLTPKQLRSLYTRAKGRALTVKLTVVFTPTGGQPRTVSRSVRVGRSHR